MLPQIVDMLRDTNFQEHAASALQFLAYKNLKAKETIVKLGGLQLLMGMLKMETDSTKARAALAIFFIVHQKAHQDMAASCIPLLVQLVSSSDFKCKLSAIKALGSLANSHTQNKNSIVTNKGIHPVINTLKSMSERRDEVVEALGFIAGEPEVNKVIIKEGGLQALQLVMAGSDTDKAAASDTISVLLEPFMDASSLTPNANKLNSSAEVKTYIAQNKATLVPTLKSLLLNIKFKAPAVRLLAILAALAVDFTVDIQQVVEVVNVVNYSDFALRLMDKSYAIGETPAVYLQPAIPGLNQIMQDADPKSVSYMLASKYLMHMLSDPETVDLVSDNAGTRKFLEHVAKTGEASFSGIDAIWTLLESDTTFEESVVQNGGIGMISSILESLTSNSKSKNTKNNKEEEGDIMRAVLSTIRILSFSYADELAQNGVIANMVTLMMERGEHILVLQAFWVILVGSEIGRKMLVKEGVVDLLVELVGSGKLNSQGKTYAEQCLFLLRSSIE